MPKVTDSNSETTAPKATRQNLNRRGLTLLEVLVAMTIMGVIMLAFTQLFSGSLRASSTISARSELLSEGQIAQQLIVSRLKEAAYIYPPGTRFVMTNTVRTRNTVRTGQSWTVGADPVVALLAPPKGSPNTDTTTCSRASQSNKDMCYMFYAYYPVERGVFMDEVNLKYAPQSDPANGDAWLLMEYRQHVYDGVNRAGNRLRSPPDPSAVLGRLGGSTAQILVDYVQPTREGDAKLFAFRADGSVELNLQMGRVQHGRRLELPLLSVRAYPRNAPLP